tara:strand:- start:471 stop:671 length:201 start_codon:yes stop_codon:yes gene_type:complete
MIEYIYFDDNNEPLYSSSDVPLEFEDQTLCVVLKFQSEFEREIILNAIFNLPQPTDRENHNDRIYS